MRAAVDTAWQQGAHLQNAEVAEDVVFWSCNQKLNGSQGHHHADSSSQTSVNVPCLFSRLPMTVGAYRELHASSSQYVVG